MVGDEYVRGVSGGERKRVSITEMLATKPTVVCWDNSTRGLDVRSSHPVLCFRSVPTNPLSDDCLDDIASVCLRDHVLVAAIGSSLVVFLPPALHTYSARLDSLLIFRSGFNMFSVG